MSGGQAEPEGPGRRPRPPPSESVCQLPREESRDGQAEVVQPWLELGRGGGGPVSMRPGRRSVCSLGRRPRWLSVCSPPTNSGSRGLPQRQHQRRRKLTLPCPGNQGLSPGRGEKTTGHPTHTTAAETWRRPTPMCLPWEESGPSHRRYVEAPSPEPHRMWPHLGVGSWQVLLLS